MMRALLRKKINYPFFRGYKFPSLSLLFSMVGLIGCSLQTTTPQIDLPTDYPNDELLVTPTWLNEHIGDSDLRIIDMRAPDDYMYAHIPGAVNVPVDDITATVGGIPFEIDQQEIQAALNRIGLQPDMTVVVYDDLGMLNSGRMFFTLEYVGQPNVRVLHGGWNAWIAASGMTSTKSPEVRSTVYPIDVNPEILITAAEVLDKLDNSAVAILDARSPQEYAGEVVYGDRGGHIPGAINLVWRDTLTGGDTVYTTNSNWQAELRDPDVEYFKTPIELQTQLNELGVTTDQEVIVYCQTLWRGAQLYFFMRLMGYDNVHGYDGSWAEWAANSDLPVVSGPNPGAHTNSGTE